jgi:hypothetical protein
MHSSAADIHSCFLHVLSVFICVHQWFQLRFTNHESTEVSPWDAVHKLKREP